MGCAVSKQKLRMNQQPQQPQLPTRMISRVVSLLESSPARPVIDPIEEENNTQSVEEEQQNREKKWCEQVLEEWRNEQELSEQSLTTSLPEVFHVIHENKTDFLRRVQREKEQRKRMAQCYARDDTILELPTRMPTVCFSDHVQ